jgi:hypothetical protein
MATWYISAVRYNTARTHIDSVRISQSGGATETWPRSKVVQTIEGGGEVWTNPTTTTQKAKVEVVVIKGTKYIKTVRDNTERDNLGSLPEF